MTVSSKKTKLIKPTGETSEIPTTDKKISFTVYQIIINPNNPTKTYIDDDELKANKNPIIEFIKNIKIIFGFIILVLMLISFGVFLGTTKVYKNTIVPLIRDYKNAKTSISPPNPKGDTTIDNIKNSDQESNI